jgi:hypothetical protein
VGLAAGPGDEPELAVPDGVAGADGVSATDGLAAGEGLGDGLLGAECICTYAHELAPLIGLTDIGGRIDPGGPRYDPMWTEPDEWPVLTNPGRDADLRLSGHGPRA